MKMVKRKIIEIDEEKCNGCSLCIPDCPEGALQIIDGKARLISDLFCDGLGACIGSCPKGAIKMIEREAQLYNEQKVMEKIVKQGKNVIKAHLQHLKDHGEKNYLREAIEYLKEKGIENPLESKALKEHAVFHGCPGSRIVDFRNKKKPSAASQPRQESELRQWPVQLTLVSPKAPYFNKADLLIAADCVPFAYADFHHDFLRNRSLVIGCPKLDDTEFYKKKLTEILKSNNIRSIAVLHMEVPCCYGLQHVVENAIKASRKKIKLKQTIITIDGNRKD